jgi:hypothetical protein
MPFFAYSPAASPCRPRVDGDSHVGGHHQTVAGDAVIGITRCGGRDPVRPTAGLAAGGLGRDHQIDRAAESFEQGSQADEAEASESAVFESRDRGLVNTAEPFELPLRVAQPEASAADDEPEVSQTGDLTCCERLSFRPDQRTFHAVHGSTGPFAHGSTVVRRECTAASPDIGFSGLSRRLDRNMQRTASQTRSGFARRSGDRAAGAWRLRGRREATGRLEHQDRAAGEWGPDGGAWGPGARAGAGGPG